MSSDVAGIEDDVVYGSNYDEAVPAPSPPKRQKSKEECGTSSATSSATTFCVPVTAAPAPALLTELLGPTLRTKAGTTVSTSDALAGKKAVGLYFSAHWCGPCRRFTPKLSKAYTSHLKAKGLEIVFVSSDQNNKQFEEYYGEHGDWLALPYSARDIKAALSTKFKVQGIPNLVILDGATGKTISKDAGQEVLSDPKGLNFPWKPKTFAECLGTEFLSNSGDDDTVELDDVKARGAKYLGLYFSASWCPPCVRFTPRLADAYTKHLKEGKQLEVVFVSADKTQDAFQKYFAKMPWLAIPPGDPRVADLEKHFKIEGFPTLALIDLASGELITKSGYMSVQRDPSGQAFPWWPSAAVNAEEEGPEDINEVPSFCLLLDQCDKAAADAAVAALEAFGKAQQAAAKAKGEDDELDLRFYYAMERGGEFSGQIRQLCHAPPRKGQADLLLLDIPDQGGFYTAPADVAAQAKTGVVTVEGLGAFYEQYGKGTLQRRQLNS